MDTNDSKNKVVPVTIEGAREFLESKYGATSGRDYDIMLAPGGVSLTGEPIKLEVGALAKPMNSFLGFSNTAMPLEHVLKYGFQNASKGVIDINGEVYLSGKGDFKVPMFNEYENGVPSYMPDGTTAAYAVINLGKMDAVNRTFAKSGLGIAFEADELADKIMDVIVLKQ